MYSKQNGETFTVIAKEHGFIFDDDVYYDVSNDIGNGYLMATEVLLNKANEILKENLSPEAYQNYLDALESGDSTPNFYAQYFLDTNKMELVATAHYVDEKGVGNFQEFEIPTTAEELELLLNALNEYCLEKYGEPFVYDYNASMEPGRSVEELHKRAMELYDKQSKDFSEFSNGELYELYKKCLITDESPFPPAYDDEVFDEIGKRNLVKGKALINVYSKMYSDEQVAALTAELKAIKEKKEKNRKRNHER